MRSNPAGALEENHPRATDFPRAMASAAAAGALRTAASDSSSSGSGGGVLIRSLYRCLLRRGKWFDARPAAKAVRGAGERVFRFWGHVCYARRIPRTPHSTPPHPKPNKTADSLPAALQLPSPTRGPRPRFLHPRRICHRGLCI